MEALAPTRHVDGRGVAAGSPDAGEASRNDGRRRGEIAGRALSAADRDSDGELAGENAAESALIDSNLAEGRFLGHKSSTFEKLTRRNVILSL